MDPNVTLQNIRTGIEFLDNATTATDPADVFDRAHELACDVRDLDSWIRGEGFLPTAWQR